MLFNFLFKNRKNKHPLGQSEKKFDMNYWMNLTKEERLEMDIKDKNKIKIKKQILLKSIRDEYIKLKRKNNKN
tara:strand:+ start:643 stop:861 length:219 start_codon:yes stop_codon:yes gene_type:complete